MHILAQQVTQPSGRKVFSFAATAEMILQMADVPHIGRGSAGLLVGYQRPEIASHIQEIRRYLDSPDSVLPNAIILAFDERVRFRSRENVGISEWGELIVPDAEKGAPKPGFIVDGQQRLAALASCSHHAFPVFTLAMIAPSVEDQRKQFVLVNRTRPLPQGMIYELLPEIGGVLPQSLAKQQLAASFVTRLNLTPGSVLYHRVKSPTCPEGIIKDNSLRRAILNSLTDGALMEIIGRRRSDPGMMDYVGQTLEVFWKAVGIAFSNAWILPPRQSRLTHGVGIVSMGFVFDNLYLYKKPNDLWTEDYVVDRLRTLAPYCAWTTGMWRFAQEPRMWNSLQNVDRDIRLLSSYLIKNIHNSR